MEQTPIEKPAPPPPPPPPAVQAPVKSIPADPVAQSSDWRVTTEETVQPSSDFQTTTAPVAPSVIIDVHSSAPGADRNGVLYSNY